MIHGITLEPVAEITTDSREHPKLWPTKQILQCESLGSDSLSLFPDAKLLKMFLKIWLLPNITLINSLSLQYHLASRMGKFSHHVTNIFDNSSESKYSTGGIHFLYFKPILPTLVKRKCALIINEVKRNPNPHFLLALESADIRSTCKKDALHFHSLEILGHWSCSAQGMKSCGAWEGHSTGQCCPDPKCLGWPSPLFWKYPCGTAGFILYQSFW